jgi:ABC-2 type transport system ATP-binding protein
MPAVQEPAVSAHGLTIRYGAHDEVTAVDHIDLTAQAGEVLVVLGPNGAGKTSTIEALEGYRPISAGQVSVLGLDPSRDHAALTQRMGVMLQKGGVYPMLGPRQVLHLFASYYPDPIDTDELLELVALRPVAGTPWRHLSGGEQQRLSLALALIGQPEVVFLDEPTAGVDPEGRLAIRRVVADLRSNGVCVILTTHELNEASNLADRIVILSSGHIVREGTPGELTASSGADTATFRAPAGLDTASLASALGSGTAVRETSPGNYRLDGASSPSTTAALATWLAERDAALIDFSAGRSLEDIYFEAVGPTARQEGEPVESTRRRSGRRHR